MGEVFITRKGGGGKAAAPTLAVTSVGGSFVQLAVTNNDQTNQATIFLLANYDTTSATDFDILAAQSGTVINVAANTTVSTIVSGLDPDTSHTVSAQAAVIKKLSSSIVTTETINLSGTGVTAPTVGPITENLFTSTTFIVTNNDTVVPQIIKANITESTTVPTVYPFESSTLAPSATGSITVSDLTSATVYYIHARAFDGNFTSSNVVFGPYTQSSPIVATGGTITNYTLDEVDYRVHTFTGNGTFAVTSVPNITGFNQADYLIIAGGGGGGGWGGGGGAGGYRTTNGTSGGPSPTTESKVTITAQNYEVTVGGGGNPGTSSYTRGGNGAISSVFNITSTGGGGGGAYPSQVGLTGGSGGGATAEGTFGAGTSGQGFAGGAGPNTTASSPYRGMGGGGGAGQAGQAGNQGSGGRLGGNGGNGLANLLRTGANETRGGGGGGHSPEASTVAQGGLGGGGNGGRWTPELAAQPGVANTGGGGGSAWGSGSSTIRPGGSGIVVIRYVVGGTV